jgi:hypothetical protein
VNRKTISWIVVVAVGISLLGAFLFFSPLRWPTDSIKNWLLGKASLGSSVSEVKTIIAQQGWRSDLDWQGTNSLASPRDYPYVKGTHIINAYLGHYQGIPFRADIDAFWGFDDQGKLIDLYVRKDYDAP